MKRLSSDSFCPQEAPTTRAQDSSPTSTSTRTRAAPAHDDRRPASPTNWPLGSQGIHPIAAIFDSEAPESFRRGRSSAGGRPMLDGRGVAHDRALPRPSEMQHPMSQRDHTGPREGKRKAEKPALVSVSIWVSLDSAPWPPWLIVCLPLRIPGTAINCVTPRDVS